MKRSVDFLPQFNGFGLEDAKFQKIARRDAFPSFTLSPADYVRLGVAEPDLKAPVVGLLFGREEGHYCSDWNYVQALVKAGMRVMFLDFDNCRSQLTDCDALVLPGGAFASPEKFYTDGKTEHLSHPTKRSQAYSECIFDALKYKMPILGICAGAQMIAGAAGMKLYRSKDCCESPLEHKTNKAEAHRIWLVKDTPFAKLMGNPQSMFVNSRHSEFLAPERVQREELKLCDGDKLPLDIYATASDGIPEAWGDMDNGILCVQWHPEDMKGVGELPYRWLADRVAADYL
jgi:putative glutamine amidotransferase